MRNLQSKKGRILSALVAAFAISVLTYRHATASSTASANANATANIVGSIAISKTQDLLFGQAAPSDVALTVPATSGTARAQFAVTGAASTSYTITIPAGTINMITGAGATADDQIVVSSFTSSPSGTGTLSAGGTDTLYVGATRAAIRATQTSGSYSGSFTVTVNY